MAGSVILTTPGFPTKFRFSARTFGGRAIQTALISDVNGSWSFQAPVSFTGGITKAGLPVLNAASLLPSAFVGSATSPASVAVAGAVVGDTVVAVINMTTGAPDTTHFEGTVSVAGHIAQLTGSGDLSADKFMVLLTHQS